MRLLMRLLLLWVVVVGVRVMVMIARRAVGRGKALSARRSVAVIVVCGVDGRLAIALLVGGWALRWPIGWSIGWHAWPRTTCSGGGACCPPP